MNGRLAPGVALAVAALLAGCLGGGATPAPPTPTPEPLATPVVTHYPLNATVWQQGLIITVRDATATLDAKGGPVTVTLSIGNPGTDPATLDAPLRLTASGDAFDPVHGTSLPEVSGGSFAEVSVVFEVIGHATIDDGVLRVGRTADHVAQIPFRPGPVALVTLKPRAGDLKVTVTAGGLRIVVRGWAIRWDLPDWYDELPTTVEALTLTYDVTYTGTFSGGFAFTADNVALRLPDGTLVAPRRDGHSQSVALVAPGQTLTSLSSRFEIPNGTAGTLALIATDGSAQKPATFKIGP